jgi:2-hydroxychromene-2-carboxylate isomerase
MIQPDFIFDFASPNAYLAHHAVKGVEQRTGVRFRYVPCLLGGIFKTTGNQAPMLAFANVKNKLDYDMLEFQRFIDAHQLTQFKMNPHFPVNTVLIQRGACALEADQPDRLMDYIEAGLKALWEDEQNLGDPDVVHAVFNAAGFDAEALFARAVEPEIKQRLIDNTAAAVERGAFGIPTFYVGEEMFFGKERLGQVEAEIEKQSA